MSDETTPTELSSEFVRAIRTAVAPLPPSRGSVATSRAPTVIDVMGGIGESSGSLVLTATACHAIHAAAWYTGEPGLRFIEAGANPARFEISAEDVARFAADEEAGDLIEHCRGAEADWAASSCLAAIRLRKEGVWPEAGDGLALLTWTDLPAEFDFGRQTVRATAAVDVICRLIEAGADAMARAEWAAACGDAVTGVCCRRIALTALLGAGNGSILQTRFHPEVACDSLELPEGICVAGGRTRLTRPTTSDRLLEARICAEMGRRMITELERIDGVATTPGGSRLAAVTPTEYVERFRDRLPAKIKGQAFVGRFGGLRGVNGQLDPASTYKVRSRAEHQIYENRRVHEFAACIARARRGDAAAALAQAGELMYASHWSHSQRCGIGGVEADQLVSAIRRRGQAAGLFGAKVTGGGEGGEIVILMRDDATARSALADAVAEAEALSNRSIETFWGHVAGAQFFEPAPLVVGETTSTAS